MNPQNQMAFEFAADLAKQLITLSTGILALTITFTKDLLKRVPAGKLWTLKAAWVGYFLTIVFGILSLMALTGILAPKDGCPECKLVTEKTAENAEKKILHDPNNVKCLEIAKSARNSSKAQIISFLAATILVIAYGITTLKATNGALIIEDDKDPKKKD